MGKIHKLEPKIANMIAAGEVIERLGNVVKELVENAIDAQATVVTIQLWEAGMKRILVSDNGIGMEADDAVLAFERHATSKIVNEYDLFHLVSLGFRGEALASIGAVAKVQLKTSTQSPEGTCVEYENGRLVSVKPIAFNKGTTFEVTHLFYQLPARFKHLKSPQIELAYTVDLVNKLALAHPHVAITLENDDKLLLKTDGANQVESVMASIYGMKTVKGLQRFDYQNRDYRIIGYLASPLFNRSSRNAITLIANDRPIRNYKTLQAIIEGFHQLIPKGRYPIAVVRIIADPLLIDCNVHPTKQDVKFSEETALHTLLSETIQMTLAKQVVIETPSSLPNHSYQPSMFSTHYEPTLKPQPEETSIREEETVYIEPAEDKTEIKRALPEWDYIGQFYGTYLLFQNDKGLYLLDQHAAAERIRYERYSRFMGEQNPTIKPLLFPLELTFSNLECVQIEPYVPELTQMGLSIDIADNTVFVHSIPVWFDEGLEPLYAETTIRTLIAEKPVTIAHIRDELAILLACKHSIKANHYLSQSEVTTLVDDLRVCKNPYTCPHGRPIIVEIDRLTVEKWFKRVM